jgi:t-SNARE complex subunit (syntaxin)
MNETKIIRMYTSENKSTYEIAEHMSTYPNKIRRILKRHGVSLKTHSEAQKAALKKGRAVHPTGGRERTLEERIKISSAVHSYWENMDESEREQRVESARKRFWGLRRRQASSKALRKL